MNTGATRRVLVGGWAMLAGLGIAVAQFSSPNPATSGQLQQLDRGGHAASADDPPFVGREMQEKQLKRLREEHQKEIFSDTDRLVTLATNLKAEVDKRDRATAPDVVKNVDEIGKLAKRVSERIKMQ